MTHPQTLEALLTGALPPALYRCSSRVRVAAITDLAAAHGWRVYRLNGRKITSKADFLHQAARSLHFPGYFGYNWDALEECLNDMDADQPALLLFDYAGRFAATDPNQFAAATEILAAAAANRHGRAAPLAVLVRGGGAAAAHLPVVKG